ncbi:MAG: DUF1732 domain-containing protein [Candidatus Omnitrophota bacterium]
MRSMTAYANVYKKQKKQTIQVTLRSANFKYLEVAMHDFPSHNVLLEEKIKDEIKKTITRGKVEVYVFLKGHMESEVFIDELNLAKYIAEAKKLTKKYSLSQELKISDFLNLPQVISWSEKRMEENMILSAAREGVKRLLDFKERQGEIIRQDMIKNLKHIKENLVIIKESNIRVIVMENGKEDINEEVALASFYVNDMEKKINSKSTISKGRSIDFLTQEILRELNSSSSKTKNKAVAPLIVECKNYLDRVREQAQNVE